MEVEPMVRYQDPKLMRHEQRSYVREVLNELLVDINICLDNVPGETQIAESGEELICQEFNRLEWGDMISPMSGEQCDLLVELQEKCEGLASKCEALEAANERLRELCRQLTPAVKPKRKVKR